MSMCSHELVKWLYLNDCDAQRCLKDVLDDLQAMTPEERTDLNNTFSQPFGFSDLEAEIIMLVQRYGYFVTADRFVEFEAELACQWPLLV